MQITNVVWTDVAIQSLKETNHFILETWNELIAHEFLSSIDKTIELLTQNPMLGISVKSTNYRRALLNRHISLFYEVSTAELKILLIWDNRQDPDKLIDRIKNTSNI